MKAILISGGKHKRFDVKQSNGYQNEKKIQQSEFICLS